MRSSRTIIIGTLVVALAACAAVAIRAARAKEGPKSDTAGVVARVNGTPITADEVALRLGELLPSASYHLTVDPARLLSLRRAALDDLVLDELIYREAIANHRAAPEAVVNAELAAVKARFDDQHQFAAALGENGLSERQFRERLARTATVRAARDDHARQALTDHDIDDYYRDHSANFQRPEEAHVLELLVHADPADPGSFSRAERKACRLLARLERGEDFGALAREFSDDEYRVKDGDMGFVHRGRLDETFDAAVSSAPVGRFALARSLHGFQVFKVVERRPPAQLSLDEARPIIAEGLGRQRREARVRAWHARLLQDARVEIRDAALRAARAADRPTVPMTLANRMRAAATGGRGE